MTKHSKTEEVINTARKVSGVEAINIPPPQIDTIQTRIIGTAPYMQARFSEKARNMMREKHEAGSVSRKGKIREARSFEDDYKGAFHRSAKGWAGIPAAAFRSACI